MTNTIKQILGEDIPGSEDQDVTGGEFDHVQVIDWDEFDEVFLNDPDVELAATNYVNAIIRLAKDNNVDIRKNRDTLLLLASSMAEGSMVAAVDQAAAES